MSEWTNEHATKWYGKYSPLIPRLRDEVRLKRMRSFCILIDVYSGGKKALAPLEAMIMSLCCGKFSVKEIVETCRDALNMQLEESIKLVGKTLSDQNSFLRTEPRRIMGDNRFRPKDYIYTPKPMVKDRVVPYETPLEMVLVVTNRCNLRCIYCYRAAGNEMKHELTTREIFDLINQMSKLKIVRIFVTGGEPLIRPDFTRIVAKIMRHDIHPYISTNGLLVTEELVQSLKDTGLPVIQVSLDAVTQKKFELLSGSQTRLSVVKKAIPLFIKYGIGVMVKCVITKINWREAPDIVKFCANTGVRRVSLEGFGMSYGGRGTSDLRIGEREAVELHEMIENLRAKYAGKLLIEGFKQSKPWDKREDIVACGGLVSSLVIQPNGDVALCENLGDIASLVFGNVRQEQIAQIWGSKRILTFLNPKPSKVDALCSVCPDFGACRTGCYNRQLVESNTLYTPDPFCWRYRATRT